MTQQVSKSPLELTKTSCDSENISKIVKNCYSNDLKTEIESCEKLRNLVLKTDEEMAKIVKSGIIPRLLQFIKENKDETLVFEALWILTNIASSPKLEFTQEIVSNNGLQIIIHFIYRIGINNNYKSRMLESGIWALSNIIGGGVKYRNIALQFNGLGVIIKKTMFVVFRILLHHFYSSNYVINDVIHIIFNYYCDYSNKSIYKYDVLNTNYLYLLKTFSWTITNFIGPKNGLNIQYLCVVLPTVVSLLGNKDKQVIFDMCSRIKDLSYFANDSKMVQQYKLHLVVNSGCMSKLIQLLDYKTDNIASTAIEAMGNLVAEDSSGYVSQKLINDGILAKFNQLLNTNKLTKLILWTLSNIILDNSEKNNFIHLIFQNNLYNLTHSILKSDTYDSDTKMEGIYIIHNTIDSCNTKQLKMLINLNYMSVLCPLLKNNNNKMVKLCVECIKYILSDVESQNDINLVIKQIKECNSLETMKLSVNNEKLDDIIKEDLKYILWMYFDINCNYVMTKYNFDFNVSDFFLQM